MIIEQPVEDAHDRRRRDRLPARARDRGAGRDAHVLSRARRAQPGRERRPQPAQLLSRSAAPQARDASAWAKYIDEAIATVSRPQTDVVIAPAPLAGVGHARRRSTTSPSSATSTSTSTTRPCGCMNKGWRPAEIAEAIDAAAGPRRALARARLLRHGQPQREGGLSALSRLVRRQPRATSIRCRRRRARAEVRRVHGRRRGRDRAARKADFAKGEYRWVAEVMKPGRLRRARQHRGARAVRRRAGADGLPGRVGDLAQRLPLRRAGAAPRRVPAAGAHRHRRRHAGRPRRPTSSST